MIIEKITTKKIRKAIGKELWHLRQQKNFSLAEVSRCCELSPKIMERVELGRGVPIYVLIKMITFYKQKIKIELVD